MNIPQSDGSISGNTLRKELFENAKCKVVEKYNPYLYDITLY
mgnify:CR=1 FL=1